MKFSPAIIRLATNFLLMRTALAFASASGRGFRQSSQLSFHSIGKNTNNFALISPWYELSHRFRKISSKQIFPFVDIRGGNNSERYASTTAVPEADSSTSEDDSSKSLKIKKEMQELSNECEKKGISSGIVESSFGGLEYISMSPESARKHRVIFVLGGPGAGKGTQCENIISTYNCVHHFSVGELLRNVPKDSQYAELIDQCLVAGKIVPVEISLSLLREAMDQKAADIKGNPIFLVDGFPRNFDNLSGWITAMPKHAAVLGAFVFDCPIEELEKRILDRGKTSGRSDDNLTSARKRFNTFQEQTTPVVEILESLQDRGDPLRVFHIAGEKNREDVWIETQNAMNDYLMGDILSANSKLIDAVEKKDVDNYATLCDIKMLTDGDEKMSIKENEGDASKLSSAFKSLELIDGVGDSNQKSDITNVKIDFQDGAAALVSYDRSISLENEKEILSEIHETRVWKLGEDGWKNVHFIRGPK